MSSLLETFRMIADLRSEMKEIIKESQKRWQREMKLMLYKIKENRAIEGGDTTDRTDRTTKDKGLNFGNKR